MGRVRVIGYLYKEEGKILNLSRYKAVATWHWEVSNESVCGICQHPYEGACPICRFPGDDCPLMWGACLHAFHMHCIVKWLEQQAEQGGHCPMCRQEWREAD